MIFARRQFLRLAAGSAVACGLARFAMALDYPARPVHLIVGFPPGGAADITARLMAQWLSERLGQPFIVENRPGAGTNIGTEAVVRAPADGYTLLLVSVANTVNATLYERLNFNFVRDIAPVAGLMRGPLAMDLNPSVAATTVPGFISYARANPGAINIASAGNGTPGHMAVEMFKMMTGLNLVHVPYRGAAPAMTDLLAGQVQVVFDNLPTSLEHIRAGKIRALAVTSAARSPALRTCRRSQSSCRATKSVPGSASALQRRRRPRSWRFSTPRSTRLLPIRRCRRALPRWRARQLR
jgi:tripartite-type tricarboxylate transporter receptor subunit TctC